MGYGHTVDSLIGGMSRLLHLRSARHNTVADLERYLELSPAQMFPVPPRISDLTIERSLFDRAIRASTLSWDSGHEVLCPRYRERHVAEYARNLKAYARWVRPDGKRRDSCLVYVHGWLEPGSWAEESTLFRKWARELGVDLLHIALPFHGRRKPKSALFSGEYFWTADLTRSVEGVRQAVWDTRSIVRWLYDQGYGEVGVTGLSLGGAVTMLLACVEPTPSYIVPLVAHLKLEAAVENAPILWRMKHDLESWGIHQAERKRLFQRLGWSSYKPVLAPQRQLWIQAREDVYIDAGLAEDQWRDWGEPPMLWIDGGHMTFPLHIDVMTRRIDEFRRGLPAA